MDQVELLMRHLFYWGARKLHPDRIQLQCGWIQTVVLGVYTHVIKYQTSVG